MNLFGGYSLTINGENVCSEKKLDVINPATEEIFATAPDASSDQLDSAVAAANIAFTTWKKTSLSERQELLRKAGELIQNHVDGLAELLTREQGRALNFAKAEVEEAIQVFFHYASMDIPTKITEDSETRRVSVHYEPLGVVGAIAPWNFPLTLSSWKIAPALLAGNTVVIKPSPFTPLCTLKIGELLKDVFPAGVLNVISGGDDLGPMMTAHPGFSKISFTGSTATGKRVMENCSKDLKRVTLELGGNDAAIIMPDVDVDKIVESVFFGAFYNSGQICVATKRLYVHADIYDKVMVSLVNLVKTVKVGNGLDEDTVLGPIQNKRQYQRVLSLIEDARVAGLTLIEGIAPKDKGYYVPLTLVDNPPSESRVVVEEAFGPVLPVIKFDNIDTLIEQVNDSVYGLAASIWSGDTEKAVAVANQLDTGTVWINENLYLPLSTPFAGRKQSGLGVENGEEGLLGFMAEKSIYIPK